MRILPTPGAAPRHLRFAPVAVLDMIAVLAVPGAFVGFALLVVLATAAPAPAEPTPAEPTFAEPTSAEPAPAAPAPAGPRAFVLEPDIDLGTIAPGAAAVAKFRIENQGDAPLTLVAGSPRPFVAGVRVEVGGAPVEPGGTGTVTVTLDTGTLSGPGMIHVPVTTNDPSGKPLDLGLRLEVRPRLLADPGYARFVTVQQEREGTITQSLWSADGATFRVTGVESPAPSLRITFREAKPGERRKGAIGSQWQIESTLSASAPVGPLSGDIVVVSDHPLQKRIRIPLSGFVRPVFAVTPPVAEVGALDPEKTSRFSMTVKNFATEKIAVERAESDVPGLALELVPVEPGRSYTLRLSVGPGLTPGPLSGTIRLFTASPKAKVIEIPFRGRVAERSAPAAEG